MNRETFPFMEVIREPGHDRGVIFPKHTQPPRRGQPTTPEPTSQPDTQLTLCTSIASSFTFAFEYPLANEEAALGESM